eukprot:TRINITY_DN8851_c0_g1_i10.p1 TRINITY_DN8851_c0_g1~~TRINITY_DN8851_c0_g1_i10.p1  ORF type:complete len:555 (+),score=63.65 TRINITY_DN8851_c0_g1_i10:1013-2677(+)
MPSSSTATSSASETPASSPPPLATSATPPPGGSTAEELRRNVSQASGAAAGAGLLAGMAGGSGAATGGKIAMVKDLMSCDLEDVDVGDEPLDWEMHPVGVGVGGDGSRYILGAVAYNPALLAGFVAVVAAVAGVARAAARQPWEVVLGHMRMPGVFYIPCLFLLAGTALSAAQLAFPGVNTTPLGVVVGVVGIGACVAACCGVYACLRWVPQRAVIAPDPRLRGAFGAGDGEQSPPPLTGWRRELYRYMFGAQIWVNADGSRFCEQYGLLFETVRPGRLWFVPAEMASVVAVGLLAAWHPGSMEECHARNSLISVVLGAVFAAVVLGRPFCSAFENLAAAAIAGLLFVATVLLTCAIAFPDAGVGVQHAALACLVASGWLAVAKAAADILTYLLDALVLARKAGARAAARRRVACKAPRQNPLIDVPPSPEAPFMSSVAQPPNDEPASVERTSSLGLAPMVAVPPTPPGYEPMSITRSLPAAPGLSGALTSSASFSSAASSTASSKRGTASVKAVLASSARAVPSGLHTLRAPAARGVLKPTDERPKWPRFELL